MKIIHTILNRCGLYTRADVKAIADAVADNELMVELTWAQKVEPCKMWVRADIYRKERNRFLDKASPELLREYLKIIG